MSEVTVHQSKPDKSDNEISPFGNIQDNQVGKNRELDTAERVRAAWNDLDELRGLVTRSRLELRERRFELRQERAQLLELEAQLWRNLQGHWDGDGAFDQAVLNRLYLEVIKARDIRGPKEENYDDLEDDLNLMEYKLEKKESRFYSQSANTHRDEKFKPSLTGSSYGSGPAWSSSSASEHTDNSSSPSNRYLSKIGDARIIRERLSELESERSHYLDLERERDAMGHPLYQPNVEFLNTFPDIHARYLEQLRQIEDDLTAFRIDAGLPEHVLTRGSSSATNLDGPAKSPSLPNVSHYFDPSQVPISARRSSDSDGSQNRTATSSSRGCINRWILERLTNSPLERVRHKAMLDDPELDDSTWLRLVCVYWGKDHAGRSRHRRYKDQTVYSASAGPVHPGAGTNTLSSRTPDIPNTHVLEPNINKENLARIDLMNLNSENQVPEHPVQDHAVHSSHSPPAYQQHASASANSGSSEAETNTTLLGISAVSEKHTLDPNKDDSGMAVDLMNQSFDHVFKAFASSANTNFYPSWQTFFDTITSKLAQRA